MSEHIEGIRSSPLIHPTAMASFSDCFPPFFVWSGQWASQRIVPGTNAASRPMGFVRAWKPSGDVQLSAVVEKRDASNSPLSCRASTQAPDSGFGFPRRNRLTRSGDLETVIREGKRVRTVHLDARVLASPLGFPRIGIVVPRHQHSAVDRNTLKRRIRELVRVCLLPAMRGLSPIDVAIRARREAYQATMESLRTDVLAIQSRVTSDAIST